MHHPLGSLAFGMPSTSEMLVVLILGLLLFGRRLPEVGRTIGKTIRDLRRGLDNFKRDLNSDQGFSDAKTAIKDIKKVVNAPRKFTDPKRILTEIVKAKDPEPKSGEDPKKT